jgi:hypothetical protein
VASWKFDEGGVGVPRDDVAIGVEGLTKRFGSVVALGGVDFEAATGTVFGPSPSTNPCR